ncbi:MAG: hypothetical protein Q7S98_04380, partial [Deltaproteobacteria bacterium]|nr:hypothetical protein [Deltaproteobacteria bacterium]
ASFALQDKFGDFNQSLTGATEYQTNRYVTDGSGSLLTTAQAEGFSDAIYSGSTSAYKANISATGDYSCSTTPDIIVSMDFSASGPKAVASQCENNFEEMSFCDGNSINAVRTIVFNSQSAQGACATSFCSTGDDFACQKWADNHLGNSQGITTANAKCSSTGCCGTTL